MLVEGQEVRICVNITSKSKRPESTSHIICHQSLLHHMEDAFDEPGSHFVTVQWELVIHCLFEITEKTQVKAVKYVARMRRESYDFHLMICKHLQCLRSHMDGILLHQQDSFLVCEFFISSQFVNIGEKNC
jgi:hypothetical protein